MVRWRNRKGTKAAGGAAAALVLMTTWSIFVGAGAANANQGQEAEFVTAINSSRATIAGAAAIRQASDLDQIAARHAADMAARGAIFHNGDLGRQVQNWEALGENVGVGPDVATLHQAFLDSPAHRANIVDARYGDIGIGMASTSDGQLWVVEVFRKPVPVAATGTSAAAPAPAPAPTAAAPAPAPVRRATPPPVPPVRPEPVPVASPAPALATVSAQPSPTPVVEPTIVVPDTALVDLSVDPVRLDAAAVPAVDASPVAARPAITPGHRSVRPAATLAALLWIALAVTLLHMFRSAPVGAPKTRRLVVLPAALQST